MTLRNLISLCILGIALTSGRAGAAWLVFTGQGDDNNWTNENNWINKRYPGKPALPKETDEARIAGKTVKITTAVTVGYLKTGGTATGSSAVIIDGGSLVAVGTSDYNSANYKSRGSILVQNGGSAVFNSRFFVGYENAAGGSVTIHEGTIRVANIYHHNKDYNGTENLDTRTTVNAGGLLDVDDLVLNAGVMDLAGGTLMIRRFAVNDVDQWIKDGRMIAMGGAEGWKIEATFDSATGCTVIIAVPTDPEKPKPKPLPMPEPVTVGMLKPVMPDPFRPAG